MWQLHKTWDNKICSKSRTRFLCNAFETVIGTVRCTLLMLLYYSTTNGSAPLELCEGRSSGPCIEKNQRE